MEKLNSRAVFVADFFSDRNPLDIRSQRKTVIFGRNERQIQKEQRKGICYMRIAVLHGKLKSFLENQKTLLIAHHVAFVSDQYKSVIRPVVVGRIRAICLFFLIDKIYIFKEENR